MRLRNKDKSNPTLVAIMRAMTKKGYNDIDLARRLGVSKNAVSLYWFRIRQGRTLTVYTMNQIASILEIDTDVFFAEEAKNAE